MLIYKERLLTLTINKIRLKPTTLINCNDLSKTHCGVFQNILIERYLQKLSKQFNGVRV